MKCLTKLVLICLVVTPFLCSCSNKNETDIEIVRDNSYIVMQDTSQDYDEDSTECYEEDSIEYYEDEVTESYTEEVTAESIPTELTDEEKKRIVIDYIMCSNDSMLSRFKESNCTDNAKLKLLTKEYCTSVTVSIFGKGCDSNPDQYITFFNSVHRVKGEDSYKQGVLLVKFSNTKISSIEVVKFQ